LILGHHTNAIGSHGIAGKCCALASDVSTDVARNSVQCDRGTDTGACGATTGRSGNTHSNRSHQRINRTVIGSVGVARLYRNIAGDV